MSGDRELWVRLTTFDGGLVDEPSIGRWRNGEPPEVVKYHGRMFRLRGSRYTRRRGPPVYAEVDGWCEIAPRGFSAKGKTRARKVPVVARRR